MSAFPSRDRPRLAWLTAVAFLLALDQLSKAWFASTIALGSAVEVTTWFNLVHVLNTGAAFSLLADAGGWQRVFFIAVGFAVVVPITFVSLARRVDPLERVAGALLVAGGSGNLIDRMVSGAVTDFLDLHWRGLHWPAFNLADVFIVLAVGVWILMSFRPTKATSGSAP
ncbi:signal peptidase II [Hydrogenophaga pseudoflava]|jgi:signal peptidase II|uniref:signal peptidase II n=1 Tax=Hydrogenophaga pseudoflava TaxID=47421 RepID=UPI0027E4E032|nr:signal peptidase II [Hydrogenophaga pseudoflava]MDQ7744558.1 signal peptidase II [Hydrogenophaga pseudoflava]